MNRWNSIKKEINQQFSFFITIPALAWQFIFLYIPLLFLLALSFIKKTPQGIVISFDHFRHLFSSVHWIIIGRSLAMATTITILCLIVAYPVAYYIAHRSKRVRRILLFLLGIPFLVNLLVHIYAWFFVLEYHGIINTFLLKIGIIHQPLYLLNSSFAIALVMFHCYFPFMVLPIYTGLNRLDRNLLEAAADLGAKPWTTLRTVTLPLTLSGIREGVFLVLVPTFGEYAIPLLLGGAKKLYVGSLISDYFLVAQEPSLGSAFTVLSSVTLIIVVIITQFLLRKEIILKGAY